jgi:hypothetical protein
MFEGDSRAVLENIFEKNSSEKVTAAKPHRQDSGDIGS